MYELTKPKQHRAQFRLESTSVTGKLCVIAEEANVHCKTTCLFHYAFALNATPVGTLPVSPAQSNRD